MKKEVYESLSRNELIKSIKTELRIISLTSDDNIFLDTDKAIIHESELEEKRIENRRWEQMKENITELVLKILQENRWGIYFKSEPMQTLPVKDSSATLFKVNEVKYEQLIDAIRTQIELTTQTKEFEWQANQTKNQSAIDNESSAGTNQTLKDTEE
jgi:hypothetical protein